MKTWKNRLSEFCQNGHHVARRGYDLAVSSATTTDGCGKQKFMFKTTCWLFGVWPSPRHKQRRTGKTAEAARQWITAYIQQERGHGQLRREDKRSRICLVGAATRAFQEAGDQEMTTEKRQKLESALLCYMKNTDTDKDTDGHRAHEEKKD